MTTDATGSFRREVVVPAPLPGAVYEFHAIGDETLTTQLTVTAAGGARPSEAPAGESTLPIRERSGASVVTVLVVALASAGAGLLLVWRAERLAGVPD